MIQVKVRATHTSSDGVIVHDDGAATWIDLGGIKRIAYVEEQGATMVLDVSDSWVQFKREADWTTHALFHLIDPSAIHIISEEGEVRVDVDVVSIETTDKKVVVKYLLLQDDEEHLHQFECEWIKEES